MRREPANKGHRYEPDVLSQAEVSAMMAACNGGVTGHRNRALIAVMYRSGLRVSEALALCVDDVRCVRVNGEEAYSLRVRNGKGGKARVVGIDRGGYQILDAWMQMRSVEIGPRGVHREKFVKAGYIFCSLRGERLDSSYVRKVLPRLAGLAGIERRVHPHMLRHSHAFELAMEGVPVPLIQKQLGHADLKTTAVYVSHLGDPHVLAASAHREAFVG